jgi:hypothetical protein
MADVHFKTTFVGSEAKIREFNEAMLELDADWPYADKGRRPLKRMNCVKCGGKLYANPFYTASDIKRLARQFGVDVHIRHFGFSFRCKDEKSGAIEYRPDLKLAPKPTDAKPTPTVSSGQVFELPSSQHPYGWTPAQTTPVATPPFVSTSVSPAEAANIEEEALAAMALEGWVN